jgi:prepilin-type N-terminal cleavage/methylation domain-containing protein
LNSRGFSLVEIIVVVAILGVALTLLGMSINTIFALDVRSCAKDISGSLAREKVEAMSKAGEVFIRLYKVTGKPKPEDNGIFVDFYSGEDDVIPEDTERVGKTTVNVTVTTTSGATAEIGDTDIIIAFRKSDGSFLKLGDAWALYGAAPVPASISGEYLKSIEVYNSDSSRTIILYPATGKFELVA